MSSPLDESHLREQLERFTFDRGPSPQSGGNSDDIREYFAESSDSEGLYDGPSENPFQDSHTAAATSTTQSTHLSPSASSPAPSHPSSSSIIIIIPAPPSEKRSTPGPCLSPTAVCQKCASTERKISELIDEQLLGYKTPRYPVILDIRFPGTTGEALAFAECFAGSLQILDPRIWVHFAIEFQGIWYGRDYLEYLDMKTKTKTKTLADGRDGRNPPVPNKLRKRYPGVPRDKKLERRVGGDGDSVVLDREVSLLSRRCDGLSVLVDLYGEESCPGVLRTALDMCDVGSLGRLEVRTTYPTEHYCLFRLRWWRRTHPVYHGNGGDPPPPRPL
ncbi:hypothetical protein BJX61DRAFT_546735 [Aspergillus egyptiacus]|nr:hypothetical protein BJX61DRAFT_546735 [Aspergillus egyptiacus]